MTVIPLTDKELDLVRDMTLDERIKWCKDNSIEAMFVRQTGTDDHRDELIIDGLSVCMSETKEMVKNARLFRETQRILRNQIIIMRCLEQLMLDRLARDNGVVP